MTTLCAAHHDDVASLANHFAGSEEILETIPRCARRGQCDRCGQWAEAEHALDDECRELVEPQRLHVSESSESGELHRLQVIELGELQWLHVSE